MDDIEKIRNALADLNEEEKEKLLIFVRGLKNKDNVDSARSQK